MLIAKLRAGVQIQARTEHLFDVVKHLVGHRKVRCKGVAIRGLSNITTKLR
ncbi:hypothetical protein [Cupriavidus oxalaticus]|uniref:hypothetical protein n=1 Tax=Cupriavidus oxalaticus TaxID=96344 RepID=UPI003F740500